MRYHALEEKNGPIYVNSAFHDALATTLFDDSMTDQNDVSLKIMYLKR